MELTSRTLTSPKKPLKSPLILILINDITNDN